jgi:hypothetical protein
VKHGAILPIFLAGAYLGLVVAGVGLWLRRRDRSTLVLLAIMAVFPAAYFFHWGTIISSLVSRFNGPIYLMPLYGPLCILLAVGVVGAWRRRRGLGVALVVVLLAATIPVAVNRLGVNRDISEAQQPWRSSVSAVHGRALVFVARSSPYLMFFNPFSRNDPDLDGPLIYAADQGPANLDLISRMPDRTPYVQRAGIIDGDASVPPNPLYPPGEFVPREDPYPMDVSVTPITVVEDEALTIRVRVRNPRGEEPVAASVDLGNGPTWRVLADDGARGDTYETEWTVSPQRGTGEGSADALPLRDRLGTITVGVAYGPDAGFVGEPGQDPGEVGSSRPATVRRPDVRERFSYRLDGSSVEVALPGDQHRARRYRSGALVWFQDRRSLVDDPDSPPLLDVDLRPAP